MIAGPTAARLLSMVIKKCGHHSNQSLGGENSSSFSSANHYHCSTSSIPVAPEVACEQAHLWITLERRVGDFLAGLPPARLARRLVLSCLCSNGEPARRLHQKSILLALLIPLGNSKFKRLNDTKRKCLYKSKSRVF